jgi:hypothetical protein
VRVIVGDCDDDREVVGVGLRDAVPELDGDCVGELVRLEPNDGVSELEPVLLGVIEQESATDIPESEQAPEQGHGNGVLIPLLGQ